MTLTDIYRNTFPHLRKKYPYKCVEVDGFKSGLCMCCEKEKATHIAKINFLMWSGDWRENNVKHIDICISCGKDLINNNPHHFEGMTSKDYTGENNIYE